MLGVDAVIATIGVDFIIGCAGIDEVVAFGREDVFEVLDCERPIIAAIAERICVKR